MELKIKKYIILFLICLFLFHLCDYLFFKYTFYKQIDLCNSQKIYGIQKIKAPKYFIKLKQFNKEYEQINEFYFRPIQNSQSKKNPILIFGCSYAYGYIFDNKETISYIMSKYSKRPIINRAGIGWGIAHTIYQLKEDEKYFNSIKPPKYVFYVLMDYMGHFERMF